MKKYWCPLLCGVSALIIILATLTYVAPHYGWRLDSVKLSEDILGFRKGSLVVTRPVELNKVSEGDVIVFRLDSRADALLTHKVASTEQGSLFQAIAEGSSSGASGSISVQGQDIIGKIVLRIPLLGYFVQFLQSPAGYYVGIVIPFIILVALYVRSLSGFLRQRKAQKLRDEHSGL